MRNTFFLLAALVLINNTPSALGGGKYAWQQPDQSGRPTPGGRPGVNPSDPLALLAAEGCAEFLENAAYVTLAQAMPGLIGNTRVRGILQRAGLISTLESWEDAGRDHYSSGGPSMSDVRLAALIKNRSGQIVPVPQTIIRLNNFEDPTVDVDLDDVFIPVGNAWGAKPFAVPLAMVLQDVVPFLSWREEAPERLNLYSPRDRQVLVSAEACIMPVPKDGKAVFVPSIFNYQSTAEHPAVLVILVSNRGTSITLLDNQRDGVHIPGIHLPGQMLFHNKNGEKSPFIVEDLRAVQKTKVGKKRVGDLGKAGQSIAGQGDVNQVLMIQVPLKVPRRSILAATAMDTLEVLTRTPRARAKDSESSPSGLGKGVVDVAPFTLGRFVELNHHPRIERDNDLPIRISVVRYQVSDTTDLTEAEIETLPRELDRIYRAGENLGSLVTGDDLTRITRNFKPWTRPWWGIVTPHIPHKHQNQPWIFFEQLYGPTWMVRFADEETTRRTVQSLEEAPGR